MRHYVCFLTAALLCGACAAPESPQEMKSTTVNADGTVTFQYRNDYAQNVEVDVQFAGRQPMHRDSLTGLWTATVGPAATDIYPYHFVVDGLSVMDPLCDDYFPNEGFKNSLLDMNSDSTKALTSVQNVPHGCVEYIHYYSDVIGGYNNAVVILPPSYLQEARSYPVYYLISGTTDTEEVYYKVGRVNNIVDNMVTQGKLGPIIIVLPYGNPAKLAGSADMLGRMDWFGRDLTECLMPYIDSHYRTYSTSQDRAIGGFSRGGNQALMIGLTHLDKFAYMCAYSSFTSTDIPKVYDNAQETNSKIRLLWSGVGTDDFLYGNARDYTEFLDKKGIRCVKDYTDDKYGHTWMNARYFLIKTLPLLFNPHGAGHAMATATPTKPATGQEQQFTPGVMARLFPRPIISPDCHGDSVTFRIQAPQAKEVLLEGEMLTAPRTMERDSLGIWSLTLTLKPDVYCYNFIVDSTRICDNQNMYLAAEHGFKRSVLTMPGALYSVNDHKGEYGPVRYEINHRQDGTASRSISIRPAVSPGTLLRPVCLIGSPESGYTYESWYKIAHADLILEQMVAQNLCKPCILHLTEEPMPDAKVTLNAADYATWAEARQALIEALKGIQ